MREDNRWRRKNLRHPPFRPLSFEYVVLFEFKEVAGLAWWWAVYQHQRCYLSSSDVVGLRHCIDQNMAAKCLKSGAYAPFTYDIELSQRNM